jgi:hypothetical protein
LLILQFIEKCACQNEACAQFVIQKPVLMESAPTFASLRLGIDCMARFDGKSRERNPRLKNGLFLANIPPQPERHLILSSGCGQLVLFHEYVANTRQAIRCYALIAGLRADGKRLFIILFGSRQIGLLQGDLAQVDHCKGGPGTISGQFIAGERLLKQLSGFH